MHFTSTVSGTGPFAYAWDFGDGLGTSTAANPTYTYAAAGDFTATLVVTGACGTATFDAVVTVLAECVTPTASFVSDSPVVLGNPMHFTSTVSGTGPFAYAWDLGDGLGTSTAANPTYTYAAAGDFSVTLVVTGTCGTDTFVQAVQVQPVTQHFAIYLPVVFK
jgi:PKD repeat protein